MSSEPWAMSRNLKMLKARNSLLKVLLRYLLYQSVKSVVSFSFPQIPLMFTDFSVSKTLKNVDRWRILKFQNSRVLKFYLTHFPSSTVNCSLSITTPLILKIDLGLFLALDLTTITFVKSPTMFVLYLTLILDFSPGSIGCFG